MGASERYRDMSELMKIKKKIEGLGLDSFITKRGGGHRILTNGHRLVFRRSSTPRVIGKKAYFHAFLQRSSRRACMTS
jgi:hypothetical protein